MTPNVEVRILQKTVESCCLCLCWWKLQQLHLASPILDSSYSFLSRAWLADGKHGCPSLAVQLKTAQTKGWWAWLQNTAKLQMSGRVQLSRSPRPTFRSISVKYLHSYSFFFFQKKRFNKICWVNTAWISSGWWRPIAPALASLDWKGMKCHTASLPESPSHLEADLSFSPAKGWFDAPDTYWKQPCSQGPPSQVVMVTVFQTKSLKFSWQTCFFRHFLCWGGAA